jgi:hypothetical protein
MSEGWKVAGIFFGVIGAAAIISQLNKGTLVQSVSSFLTSAVGDAFSSSSTTTTGTSTAGVGTSQSAAKNHSTKTQTTLV